jgi:hypothetical protein
MTEKSPPIDIFKCNIYDPIMNLYLKAEKLDPFQRDIFIYLYKGNEPSCS